MNYLTEIKSFYDWLEINSLPSSAIALWHSLMHINNKAAWAKEFTVARSVLCYKSGLEKDAFLHARNKLQQSGLVTFKARTGGRSSIYTINSIACLLNRQDTQQDTQRDTQQDTQPLNKQNKTKQNYIITKAFIALLNERTGKNFSLKNKATLRNVSGRMDDGYSLEDFLYVVNVKCDEWLGTDNEKYLTPDTLLRPLKFEKYRNQPAKKQSKVEEEW